MAISSMFETGEKNILFGILVFLINWPRRRFNVYNTSIRRQWCHIDVLQKLKQRRVSTGYKSRKYISEAICEAANVMNIKNSPRDLFNSSL